MIEKFSWFLIGFSLGYVLSVSAFDPCDKQKEERSYRIEPYNERDDAAMQFHWQDHQPSLHPR